MAPTTKKVLIGVAAGAGAVVGVSLLWRSASRRYALPCPWWLSGSIVNPVWQKAPPTLDRLELEPGMRVLDVGCGPGRVAIPAAEAVGPEGEVVALDLQSHMLRKLEERAEQRGVTNIQTREGDITRDMWERAAFDRAILVTVLGEIPDRAAALRTILGALKPGGILSVTEVLPDPHFQTRSTVLRLAAAVGFRLRGEYGNWAAFTLNFERPAA